jgi:hypothetical protein
MFNPRDLYSQYPRNSPENPYHRSNQYDPKKLKSQYPRNSPENPYHRSNQYDPKKLKSQYLQFRPNDPNNLNNEVNRDRSKRVRRWQGYLGLTAIVILIVGIVSIFVLLYRYNTANPNIDMTRTGFTRTSVHINPGETLHFQNPADGVMQVLCIGVDQRCQPEYVGPPFYRGLTIRPGQTVDVVFEASNVYSITSTTTPHMNITISVDIPRSGGIGGG